MTAVCLKAKNSLKTEGWSNIFTGFNTEAKSCLFIKQLTSTCVSTILYLRKVLSDDHFESKSFEGMTLKILKSGRGKNYVSKIEQWLEGAFEAIEKKYLKRLMLDIQDAETNLTLEIYTMTFNYNKEMEGLNPMLSTTTSNNRHFAISNTQINTIKLLQMCQAVTQTYSNLPSQITLSMRLSYYENTPENYQPSGFVAWDPVNPKFSKQARSIEMGITSTQHHFFKLFNKSCLNDKFFEDLENQSENSDSTLTSAETDNANNVDNFEQEKQTKVKKEKCFVSAKKSVEPSLLVESSSKPENTFVVSEKCNSLAGGNKTEECKVFGKRTRKTASTKNNFPKKVTNKAVVETQKVRCACLSSDKTDTMFPCLGCRFLVHAECYGILQFDSTKKIRFHCHLCQQMDKNLKCHDKVMASLKSSSDQQKLSLLRRVLRHCTLPGVNYITLKSMKKISGTNCPNNVLNIVLSKMIEIGVAIAQGKRKTYLIDKHVLTSKLVQYFYKVQNSTRSQSQTSPKKNENFKRKNNFDEFHLNKRSKHSTAGFQDFLTCKSQTSQQSCDIFC